MWKFFVYFYAIHLIDGEVRRFSEPLQRIVYDEETKTLVIASADHLYSINSSNLNFLHQVENRPMTTIEDHVCQNSTALLPFIQLFLLVNRSILLCSTSNRGGSCQLRSLIDLHLEKNSSERLVASSSFYPSVGFISEISGLFYIGTTFDRLCDRFYEIPTIAARSLFSEPFLSPIKFHSAQSALQQTTNTLRLLNLRLIKEYFLHFIYAFESNDFAYFISIQQVNLHEKYRFQTKIGRFCQNISRPMLKSYVEIPLMCADRYFYLVKAKYSPQRRILYGLFRNTTLSNDSRSAQAICQFSIEEIQRGFAETIERCVVDGQGSRGLAHLSPKTPCVARKTTHIDFCSNDDEHFLQYPIGGDRPIVQRRSLVEFHKTIHFTAMEIVEEERKIFVVLSDDRGHIRIIRWQINTSNIDEIYQRNISNSSIIAVKIIKEKNHFDLVILTENELIKEKVFLCENFSNRFECSLSDRFCRWSQTRTKCEFGPPQLHANCSSIRSCSFCSTFFDRCFWNSIDRRCDEIHIGRNFSIEHNKCSKMFLSNSIEYFTPTSNKSSLTFFVEQCDEDLPIKFCHLTNHRKRFVSIGSKIVMHRSNDENRLCQIECFFSKISDPVGSSIGLQRPYPLEFSIEYFNRTRTIINDGEILLYHCNRLASNCSSCVELDAKFRCVWCEQMCLAESQCRSTTKRKKASKCLTPKINKIDPLIGIESGGTLINIEGENLSIVEIFIGSTLCQIHFVSSSKIECETNSFLSTRFSREEEIRLMIDGQIATIHSSKFLVVADPLLYSFDEFFQYRSFKSGGHRLTVLGENFHFVQNVQLELNKFLVISPTFHNATHLIFLTPAFADLRSSNQNEISITLFLDNFNRTSSLIYFDDPFIKPWEPFRQVRSNILNFYGENFTSIGSTMTDVHVFIDCNECPLIEFRSDRIVCQPKTLRRCSASDEMEIIVSIDSFRSHVGFLIDHRMMNFFWPIVVVTSIVFIIILSVFFFIRYSEIVFSDCMHFREK